MYNYKKLWHILLTKGLKKTDLQKGASISWLVISKLTQGECVGADILTRICNFLNCRKEDIFDYIEDSAEEIEPLLPGIDWNASSREINKNTKYKSIDLFAGIGGIRLGFERAFGTDISTNFVSEWDIYAQKTYQKNFDDPFPIAGDITKINEKDIPPFDICLAGFPCQAFSMAGQRKGFDDNFKGKCRGTLFLDVARICDFHKPKVIFCENVKGLAIHDHGNTFKIIYDTFQDLGYKVFYKILNSKNFGVPQNRERIYIVAFRNDIAPREFAFPQSTDTGKCIRDILEKDPVSSKYYLSDTYVETLRRHKARQLAKGNGFGYEIRDWDEVAGAIVCGGMGRERNLIIDMRQTDLRPVTHIAGQVNREGIRKMTPREWARLQGFPDSFEFPLADVHAYKQLGNSVTVNVIEAIARKIKEVLTNVEINRK